MELQQKYHRERAAAAAIDARKKADIK